MSTINTNGINVNYPVPGINNTTQGFRDNFNSIKTNIDTAGNEISELQQRVILKSGLSGVAINNDMSGAPISNASVRGFRKPSHNLGNGISGTLDIDVTKADIQYGTLTGNTTLRFDGWVATGPQQKIELILTINKSSANPMLTIEFPKSTGPKSMDESVKSLENLLPDNTNSINIVAVPEGVTKLHYEISTINCGDTLTIVPINSSRVSKQVSIRTPVAIGAAGDVVGTICSDGTFLYVCTDNYDGSTVIWKKITLSSI